MSRFRMASVGRGMFLAFGLSAELGAQSLYNESAYQPLAGDHKAYRVGDLITVQVLENASASSTTDTASQRKNSLGADGFLHAFGKDHHGRLTVDVNGDFQGGGTTQRSNRLLATLSVTVKEVLPGGDLKVAGEQLITVNNEQHKVNLEGRVRVRDISSDNTLLSTRLGEAKITFVGNGDLSQRQKRALWRKILDWMGL